MNDYDKSMSKVLNMILKYSICLRVFLLAAVLSPALLVGADENKSNQTTATVQTPLQTIDELLFDMTGGSSTSYDFKIFKDVLACDNQFFDKELIKLLKNQEEVFVFSRLVAKEAQQLEVFSGSVNIDQFLKKCKFINETKTDNNKSDTTKNDSKNKNEFYKQEILKLHNASELAAIKSRQLQNRTAVLAWLQVLKRKYSLNWKSNDFKKSVDFGF